MKTIFEYLPNELFIYLFEYFSTNELFNLFYNQNIRFNQLIQFYSHLNYSTEQTEQSSIQSYPYIRHLSIRTNFPIQLKQFINLRSLCLDYLTNDLVLEIKQTSFIHLEYLYLYHRIHPFYMFDLRQMIFTNHFPQLKYAYISRMNILDNVHLPSSIQMDSLRYLKFNEINAQIYVFILSTCSNLYSLKFKLNNKSTFPQHTICHSNLKFLNINMISDEWPWNDDLLDEYFRCTPNIEQLKISRSISKDINLTNYDWLSSILSSRLTLLEQFYFKFYLNRSQGFLNKQDVIIDLKRRFSSIYKYQYQYRLFVF